MNYPTSNNIEQDDGKRIEWSPDSGIWSEHSYGYTQNNHFQPFGIRAGTTHSGVLMVEDPANERVRSSREPSQDTKDLIDLVQELKKSNEELRQSNQILSQKLEQTNELVQQGFKTLKDAINRIPGQITHNLTDALIHSLPVENESKVWLRESESSSIVSLPEDLADDMEEEGIAGVSAVFHSHHGKNNRPNNNRELEELSRNMKERFGFEYDDRLDVDLWLRK